MQEDLSLRTLSRQNHSQHVQQSLIMALCNRIGEDKIWVIVEAEEDSSFFIRFVQEDKTQIYSADSDDKQLGGYHIVEEFVENISSRKPNVKIIGIRDSDYTKYQSPSFAPPMNVFFTEHRDLEMMMFSFPSVKTGLEAWNSRFLTQIAAVEPFARELGYIRVYNQERNLRCCFKKAKVSLKSEWDSKSHQMNVAWKNNLYKKFERAVQVNDSTFVFDINDYQAFVNSNLKNELIYDICRGHDFISILSLMMINTDIYNKDSITAKMIELSSFNDFTQTSLYRSLRCWERDNDSTFLKPEEME